MLAYLLYRTASSLIRLVPARLVTAVADGIAFYFFVSRPAVRRNVRRNFEALGVRSPRIFAVFRFFARTIRDFLRLSTDRRSDLAAYCRLEGKETLDRAMREGRGVILITPHLGPWEIAGAYFASLGYPIHTVALRHPSDRVTKYFSRRRKAWGITDYPPGVCAPRLLSALRKGEIVVLLIDRNFSRRGLELRFLGRSVTLPRGHVVLSMRTGAPLVPCACFYERDGSVAIRVEAPVETPDAAADPVEIGNRCLRGIEPFIRAHGEQWFAFDHLWPEE